MQLKIIRVPREQYAQWVSIINPINRWTLNGLPAPHIYIPEENIVVMPSGSVIFADYPRDQDVSYALILQMCAEGK